MESTEQDHLYSSTSNAVELQGETFAHQAEEPRREKVWDDMSESLLENSSPPSKNDMIYEDPQLQVPEVAVPDLVAYSDPTPSHQVRQLIQGLILASETNKSLSDDEVERWADRFDQLVHNGNDAIPVIREYLQLFEDTVFGPEDQELLGYPSTRIALLDALHIIGGDEALALSLEILQSTADPAEIAFLVESLEFQAGDEYREVALMAAREVLTMAKEGQIETEKTDVGPLFEILYRYGDDRVAPDLLEAVEQWRFYGLISLAQLPEGAGILTLVDLVQGGEQVDSATRSQALVMLAQVSTQWEEARETLVEQARRDQIPEFYWHSIASSLVGDTYRVGVDPIFDPLSTSKPAGYKGFHTPSGNQSFSSDPSLIDWSVDEIDERIALIDELMAVNSNPTTVDLLRRSRGELVGRVELLELESSIN